MEKKVGTVSDVYETQDEFDIHYKTSDGRDRTFRINKIDAISPSFIAAAKGKKIETEAYEMIVTSVKVDDRPVFCFPRYTCRR